MKVVENGFPKQTYLAHPKKMYTEKTYFTYLRKMLFFHQFKKVFYVGLREPITWHNHLAHVPKQKSSTQKKLLIPEKANF